ncbi:MAG: thiamine-phosphate kinase [Acidobacteriota bacterium]
MPTEFEFISALTKRHGLKRIGDDCAVLPQNSETDLVVTADMLVENVDFRLDWSSPRSLGHKALAVSLSDIAAMGAVPEWAMVSIAVPDDLWNSGSLDQFYEGWLALAREYGVELVGGDISSTGGPLIIDSIVGGIVPRGKAILRSGASPGNSIYVTGTLGGAAGGLKLLEASHSSEPSAAEIIQRQLEPRPQLTIAKTLQTLGFATSMIDVSDGLSSDLGHVCSSSGVGALIYADSLPVDPNLTAHFGPDERLEMALNGGEDFELLFTCRETALSLADTVRATHIGEITATLGVIELVHGGKSSVLKPKGYRHF